MGRGDETELIVSEAEIAAAEVATRRLLASWSEPAQVPPPPGVEARVLAALAETRAGRSVRRPPRVAWRLAAGWTAVAAFALLVVVGSWGVFVNSLAPGQLVGGTERGVGLLTLTLTLAAKPLVNLLAGVGPGAALAVLALVVGALLWWRLVHRTSVD